MAQNNSNKTLPIIMATLGTIYGISPIDILPDIIPFAGWIDDVVILGGTYLNLTQSLVKETNNYLASILGLLKWILILVGGLLVVVLALIGVSIYNLL